MIGNLEYKNSKNPMTQTSRLSFACTYKLMLISIDAYAEFLITDLLVINAVIHELTRGNIIEI